MLAATRQRELRRYGILLHAAGAFVVVLIGMVFYFAVHKPTMAARDELKMKAEENRKRLSVAAKTRTEHASLNDRLHESEELAALVRRRIPQHPQTPQFLGAVNDMAEKYQMAIRDFSVGETFERDTHHEVSIRFVTSGDYESICRFLDDLVTMPRVVAFEKMTVDSEVERGEHSVDLSLLLPFAIKSDPLVEESADG